MFFVLSVICLAQTETTYVPGTVMPEDNYATSQRRNDDILMQNLENAFANKNIDQIESFLINVVSIRLDENLYLDIPTSEAISLLSKYWENKSNIMLRKTSGTSAKLVYTENDKKRMVYADFCLDGTGQRIKAINLSNHPSSTAFLR